MSILLLTSESSKNAGGLGYTCLQLESILRDIGYKVYVEITLDKETNLVVDGGYDCRLSDKIRFASYVKKLGQKYKNFCDINLILAYGAGENAYIADILAKRLSVPLYIVLCGSDINLSFKYPDTFCYNQLSIRDAQKVVGLSYELVDNAKIFCEKEDKYCVIPNVFSQKNKFNMKKINFEQIVFGTGATFLNEKKGIANLIKAFATYLKKYCRKDILLIYGKIDCDIMKAYYEIINELNISDYVKLCGYLDRDEYNKILENIDVYIQASPFEGCSNSVGDAIFNYKHILISDTGYFAEVLKNKYPQIIIDDLAYKKFADKIGAYVDFIAENDIRKDIISFLASKVAYEQVKSTWEELLKNRVPCITVNNEYMNVVMFHDVNNMYTGLDYSKIGFEKLVRLVVDKGYRLCSYIEYKNSNKKDRLIVCTFDDGYENVYINAYPIMKKYDFTATVFVCPDLVGKHNDWNRRDDVVRSHMNYEMLDDLYKNGWEIGSHGMDHYNLLRLNQSELEYTLEASKNNLERRYGNIYSFCYPFGIFKPYIKNMVSKFYEVAFSVDVGTSNVYYDKHQIIRMVPEELKKMLERE